MNLRQDKINVLHAPVEDRVQTDTAGSCPIWSPAREPRQSRYYNSSTFSYITLQTTQVCMCTSWLPGKPAAARSARGHDKVQTCYSHQGNNHTCTLEEKFQEYGGRLQ